MNAHKPVAFAVLFALLIALLLQLSLRPCPLPAWLAPLDLRECVEVVLIPVLFVPMLREAADEFPTEILGFDSWWPWKAVAARTPKLVTNS